MEVLVGRNPILPAMPSQMAERLLKISSTLKKKLKDPYQYYVGRIETYTIIY